MLSDKPRGEKQLILVFPGTGLLLDWLLFRFRFQYTESFTLHILAALTPKDYRVRILNQKRFWSDRDFIRGALVGISCFTSNALESYKIGDRFRQAGSAVVMGGIHASQLPQEALQHCDSVVIGEAESVWPQVIRDHENGTLQKIYYGTPREDWFAPSYDYFRTLSPAVLGKVGLLLGRGCQYRCEFCVPFFGKPRSMPLEMAVDLITRSLAASRPSRGRKSIHLFDSNIFADADYAKRLFNAMIPLNVNWAGSSSVDIAFDEEALQLAKASGCHYLFIGFETIVPRNFAKTSAGGMSTANDYITAIRKVQSYGITVVGGFILGLDDCTHQYCVEFLKFLLRSRLDFADVVTLTPLPGSRLFERLQAEGRITTCDWRKFGPGSHVVFKPKHMSSGALYGWGIVCNIVSLLAAFSRAFFAGRGLLILAAFGVGIFVMGTILIKFAGMLYLLFWMMLLWVLNFIHF